MNFDITQNGIITQNPHGMYSIIPNEGDGNCFFYSIIDSGITQLRPIFQNLNRNQCVTRLRAMAIHQIKTEVHAKNITPPTSNVNMWYLRMERSSYWADDYMISAIQKVLDIRIILIRSDGTIYCHSPYEKLARIPHAFFGRLGIKRNDDEDYLFTYNSIEKFLQDIRPFILIYYTSDIHFECVACNGRRIFDGVMGLQQCAPKLVSKYIRECHLVNKTEAGRDILKELHDRETTGDVGGESAASQVIPKHGKLRVIRRGGPFTRQLMTKN